MNVKPDTEKKRKIRARYHLKLPKNLIFENDNQKINVKFKDLCL